MVVAAALVVIAYFVGMFPSAQIVGRRLGHDPTREGSGNPGASNVYRTAGRRAGLIVGVIDMLKGALPVLIALLVDGRGTAHVVWIAATVGHVWPVLRGFRGGKGVATAGGGGLVLSPVIGLACGVIFFATVRLTRIAALGSLAMAVAFPTISAAAGRPWVEVAASAAVAAVLVWRHRGNIARMVGRREHRVSSG